MSSVVVFGGYGTFGAQVCRELARLGLTVVIAGRNAARAQALARALGEPHRGVVADVTDPRSCRRALAADRVAVCCAGPFSALGDSLLEAALEAGCHYADIADNRAYAARVRGWGERYAARGLCAVYGGSSLPGLSGALALLARATLREAPGRARVTLFIGNDNPKGRAAVRSAVAVLGKPISTPRGIVRGFRGREVVSLPPPFGRRAVYDFESPEYDLFPALLGVGSVSVKVGFELPVVNLAFATLAAFPWRWGERSAALLTRLGGLARGIGSSGGAVVVELFSAAGSSRAALVARRDGQRMAALPCVLAVNALATKGPRATGALTPYELLGAEPLLEAVAAKGFELVRE